jgi:hypothetical protein
MEPNQQSGHHPLDVSLQAEFFRIQSDFNRDPAEASSLQRALRRAFDEHTRLRTEQRLGPLPDWLHKNGMVVLNYLRGSATVQITQDPPSAVRSLASMAAESLRRHLTGEETAARQFLHQIPHLADYDPVLQFMEDLNRIERDFNNQDPATLTPEIREKFLDRINVVFNDAKARWTLSARERKFVPLLPAELSDRLYNLRNQVRSGTSHPQLNPAEQALHQLKRASFHSPVEGAAVGHRR